MSLKQFLVVGKSFIGVGRDKSPYELRKENLLPIFSPSGRFVSSKRSGSEMVQSDWVEQQEHRLAQTEKHRSMELPTNPPQSDLFPANTMVPKTKVAAKRKRNWLRIFSFGLFGRS